MERVTLSPAEVPSQTVLVESAQPSPRTGRPVGSRSAYFSVLERQAARQASAKHEILGDPLLRGSEMMQIMNVSYNTLRLLIKSGALHVSRTSKRGHYRCKLSEIRRFVASQAVQP
jgi:hypothetical protein